MVYINNLEVKVVFLGTTLDSDIGCYQKNQTNSRYSRETCFFFQIDFYFIQKGVI